MNIMTGILELKDCDCDDELTLCDVTDMVEEDEDVADCKRCNDEGCNYCLMTGY